MQSITTVTQKGQITIPKKLRDKIGLSAYSKVYLTADKDSIKVTRTFDILDMAGKFKPGKLKSVLAARENLDTSYRRS